MKREYLAGQYAGWLIIQFKKLEVLLEGIGLMMVQGMSEPIGYTRSQWKDTLNCRIAW